MLRRIIESRKADCEEQRGRQKLRVDRGILYSSGLIAGEGLVGILLAILAVIPYHGGSLADVVQIGFSFGNIGGLAAFGLLLASMVYFIMEAKHGSINGDRTQGGI